MPPIVADGICRYAVHGSYSGRQVINIIDMHIDTDIFADRPDVVFDQAGRIINAWSSQICAWLLNNNYSANKISWVDLDSLDGTTGERSSTSEVSWPITGAGAGDAMPGNVAMRVNKRTNAGRGRKQGRMYLCGVQENQTTDGAPNSLHTDQITGGNSRLALFLEDITSETFSIPASPDYSSWMSVVHTVGGVFDSSTRVDALEIDGTLGSQRRRLR